MRTEDLLGAVDWPAVQALPLVGCVLDLEPSFYVLDRRGDKRDRKTSH